MDTDKIIASPVWIKMRLFFSTYWLHVVACVAVVLLFYKGGCENPTPATKVVRLPGEEKLVETIRTDTIKVPTLVYVERKAAVLPRSYQLGKTDILDTCLTSDTARLCIHIEHSDSSFKNTTIQAFVPQTHFEVVKTVDRRIEVPVVPTGYVDGAEYSPKDTKWYFAAGGAGGLLILELLAKIVFHL